jgi:hypothetical protein
MGWISTSGSAPATPAAGTVHAYTDSSDKRLKTIDETPTTRVLVDRASTETLTNKTITAAAQLTSSGTAGVGYETGAGGTITQATSKATTVILNKITGQITLNAAALAASTTVTFALTNSTIAATDVIVLQHTSGGTAGSYTLNAQPGAGTANINVRNVSLGSLSEAIVISFAVIKAVTA